MNGDKNYGSLTSRSFRRLFSFSVTVKVAIDFCLSQLLTVLTPRVPKSCSYARIELEACPSFCCFRFFNVLFFIALDVRLIVVCNESPVANDRTSYLVPGMLSAILEQVYYYMPVLVLVFLVLVESW